MTIKTPTHRRMRFPDGGGYRGRNGAIVLVKSESGRSPSQGVLYNVVDPVDGWIGACWESELERIVPNEAANTP